MHTPSRRLNTTLFLAMLPLGATATVLAPSALAATDQPAAPAAHATPQSAAATSRVAVPMKVTSTSTAAASVVKPSASAKSATPKAAAASIPVATSQTTAAKNATPKTAAAAASKSVAPQNLSVNADPHGAEAGYVVADTTVALTSNWTVPSTAKAGDTTSIALPDYFDGNTISGMPIKDTSTGAFVGTLSGSGRSYTVTYTDYVETHSNVQVTTTLAAKVNGAGLTSQKQFNLTETVGGMTGSAGTYTYFSSVDSFLTPLHFSQVQETTGTYDMSVDNFTLPVAGSGAAGKQVTVTYRLPSPADGNDVLTTTPYASFDQKVLAPGAAINYDLYDYSGVGLNDAKLVGTYSTGAAMGADNPIGLKIVSSTDDTVVMTYQAPDDENKWLLVRPILQEPKSHEGGVLLNSAAVSSQHEGAYASFIYTDYDGQGYPQYGNGTLAYGYYVFDKASASGEILPVVANAIVTSVNAGKSVTVDVPANTKLVGDSTITSVKLTDKDGNPVTSDAQGTWTIGADNKPVFTANADDKAGTETVYYTVTDSNGKTSTNTITVNIVPAAAPTAPTASGVDFTTRENTPVTIDLGKHVKATAPGATITGYQLKDPATGKLVNSVTIPGKGTLTIVGPDGKAVFTPAKGYTGPVPIFTAVATDSNGQTVSFPVSGAVTAPGHHGHHKGHHHHGHHHGGNPAHRGGNPAHHGGTPVNPGRHGGVPVVPGHTPTGHPTGTPVTPSQPIHVLQPGQPAQPGHGMPAASQPAVGPKVQTDLTTGSTESPLGDELVAGFALVSIAGGYLVRRARRS